MNAAVTFDQIAAALYVQALLNVLFCNAPHGSLEESVLNSAGITQDLRVLSLERAYYGRLIGASS